MENAHLRLALTLPDKYSYRAVVGEGFDELMVPQALPGRGLWKGDRVLECQIALPAGTEEEESAEGDSPF